MIGPRSENRAKRKKRPLFSRWDLLFPLMTLLVALLGVLALKGKAEWAKTAFFPCASLLADAYLCRLTALALRMAKVRFNRYQRIVMALTFLLFLGLIAYNVFSRRFIYIWDYSNYLLKQYDLEWRFRENPLKALRFVWGSRGDDYTLFISLFTEVPFCFTSRTGNAFALCQSVNVLLPLIPLLGGLAVKLGKKCGVRNWKIYFSTAMFAIASVPVLRAPAINAMPDWLGLVFAFDIVLLTMDYRFQKTDVLRCALLFLCTVALVLTRRWYLYFVVAYYALYGLDVVLQGVILCVKGKRAEGGKILLRLVLFAAASCVCALLLLMPMVKHILEFDYAARYAAYQGGSFLFDLTSQLWYRLTAQLPILVLGVVMGLLKRKSRSETAHLFLSLLLATLLFTRVQSMGSHHMLMLMPAYLSLLILGVALLTRNLSGFRICKLMLCALLILMGIFTSLVAYDLSAYMLPDSLQKALSPNEEFYSRRDALNDRSDFDGIRAISNWIDVHCAEGEIAYVIPHDGLYNPDLFRNVNLPVLTLHRKIAFGFSVVGTHPFPMQLFEAKYVLTSDPFPTVQSDYEAAQRLNALFLREKDGYYELRETFDMGNGTTFYVYERVVPTDEGEIDRYFAEFAEEDRQFPDLYSEVVNQWKANHEMD